MLAVSLMCSLFFILLVYILHTVEVFAVLLDWWQCFVDCRGKVLTDLQQ